MYVHVLGKLLDSWNECIHKHEAVCQLGGACNVEAVVQLGQHTYTHSSEAAHACKVGTWAGKAFFPHKQLHAPFLERGIVAASN